MSKKKPEPKTKPEKQEPKPKATPAFAATKATEKQLTQLDVPALQARYLEVVGRPTGSNNKAYLVWKIREAQKGRIPIGPRQARTGGTDGAPCKVLPLRMPTAHVQALDAARQRLGLPSRMALLRRALHAYLLTVNEAKAAALFAPDPEIDA